MWLYQANQSDLLSVGNVLNLNSITPIVAKHAWRLRREDQITAHSKELTMNVSGLTLCQSGEYFVNEETT